jgi:hypothetical protein
MTKVIYFCVFLFVVGHLNAQSFQLRDLQNSLGSWEGKLTYMDYVSGKPFTMLANLKISLTADTKGYIVGYTYPKEPHANSIDTTFVKIGLFGTDRIVAFKKEQNGDFQFTTESDGIDGNENKKAALKHVYRLTSNVFSIRKEVKFVGTRIWIKRNEYLVNRVAN